LITGTTFGMAALLAAGALLLYVFIRRELIRRFDDALWEKARLLASSVERENRDLELEFEDLDMAEFQDADGPGYMVLRPPGGSDIYRSPSLTDGSLPTQSPASEGTIAREVNLPSGAPGRAVSMTFTPRTDYGMLDDEEAATEDLTLVLARDATDLYAMLHRLAAYLAAGGFLTIACSSGGLLAIIHHSTRPLRELAHRIDELDGGDPEERVGLSDAPREIKPVVRKLNDLLRRTGDAFLRERQFSSDVAHELRTPLSGIRSLAEVELSQTRAANDYKRTLREVLDITTRMQRLVESLLKLSRLETEGIAITSEEVRIEDLVHRCWQAVEQKARERDLHVHRELADARDLHTDTELLEVAVHNVLENAVIHADRGGAVRIATQAHGDQTEFCVTNPATGLSREDIRHVFERFWQADPARSGSGVRCGLGLPLTAQIMEVLGGEARAELAGKRFRLTLSLPVKTRKEVDEAHSDGMS
jgi:two-component system sensor histidine kinase QseC